MSTSYYFTGNKLIRVYWAQRVSRSPSVQLVSPASARPAPVSAQQGDGSAQQGAMSAQPSLAAVRQSPPVSAQQGAAVVQPAPVAPAANENISLEDVNLINVIGQWCREVRCPSSCLWV